MNFPDNPQTYEGKITLATPSPEQRQFFTFIVEDRRSAILSAVAGSGKTTTIVEACRLLPPGVSSRFLAFNKNIAEALKERLPYTVNSSTFHSAWFNSLKAHLTKSPKIDSNKVREILKKNLSRRDFELYFKFVCRLVGYAKNTGLGTSLCEDVPTEWFRLISHFNLFLESNDADEGEAIRYARETLRQSNSLTSVIDFDDMLYLPLLRNVTSDKSNYIFVDEAQDLNSVQRELLKRMIPTSSSAIARVIAVGDPNQAIYGFRGADNDSLDLLQQTFSAVRLPLSVSYRCSKAVVGEAQKVLNGSW